MGARLVVVIAVSAVVCVVALAGGCPGRARPELEKVSVAGRVDAADFPDARAVILLDRTEVTFAQTPQGLLPLAEVVHTRRIQVLTEAGRELARVLVPFDERSRI